MAKILGLFDRRPMIWFHYVLLVGALFGGFYLGDKYLGLSGFNTFGMFIFWYVVISISDQIIHKIIGVD